jgi:hypothetical protein
LLICISIQKHHWPDADLSSSETLASSLPLTPGSKSREAGIAPNCTPSTSLLLFSSRSPCFTPTLGARSRFGSDGRVFCACRRLEMYTHLHTCPRLVHSPRRPFNDHSGVELFALRALITRPFVPAKAAPPIYEELQLVARSLEHWRARVLPIPSSEMLGRPAYAN